MKRSNVAILVMFVLAALSVTASRAQDQDCGGDDPCLVYLPLIRGSEPIILPNHSSWMSPGGGLYVVGEIQNTTSQNLELIRVSANFFDSTGKLLDTEYDYITLDELAAGDKTCFRVSLDPPAGWASYSFEKPAYYTTSQLAPRLATLNDSASINRYDEYEIIGLVRNDDNRQVEYIDVIATLYTANGTVADCDYDRINSTILDPGQTSAFKITFYSRPTFADIASYRLQASGSPKSIVTEDHK